MLVVRCCSHFWHGRIIDFVSGAAELCRPLQFYSCTAKMVNSTSTNKGRIYVRPTPIDGPTDRPTDERTDWTASRNWKWKRKKSIWRRISFRSFGFRITWKHLIWVLRVFCAKSNDSRGWGAAGQGSGCEIWTKTIVGGLWIYSLEYSVCAVCRTPFSYSGAVRRVGN